MNTKGQNVIGLKIITLDNGKEVDSVKDIIYDPKLNQVRALLIDSGGWFSDAKILMMNDVNSIGDDAVIIESQTKIKKASEIEDRVSSIAKDGTYLTKTKVITEDGKELGSISDIFFDTSTGEVQEFEVSQGLIENVKSGKKRFRIHDIITVGEDATVVSQYTEEMVNEQGQHGGVQGAAKTGIEKAKDVLGNAKEKATDLAEKATENVQDAAQTAKEKTTDFMNRPDVTEKKEQIIGAVQNVKDTTTEKFGEMRDSVQSGEMKEKARDTLQSTKEKVTDAADQTLDKAQQTGVQINDTRKQQATGLYLTRNILTNDNSMIGTRGDMVTKELLDVAEAHGLLEVVLSSTSEQPIL
jgi:uncharacterized protein YrrD